MAFSHMLVGASTDPEQLVIRRIAPSDLFDALARGVDDFIAMPSHAVFLCVIYPLLGIALIAMTLGESMLPLAFPIAAGFALVGPLAAIGLYELSRRREAGLDSSTSHALDVLHSPSLGAIVALGLLLMAIFLIWLAVADAIYIAYFGYHGPASIGQFISDVFQTRAGWMLIVVGTGVGFLFAVLVLTISAISFPLLLDRDVGAAVAVLTSIRVVAKNPLTMALWGFRCLATPPGTSIAGRSSRMPIRIRTTSRVSGPADPPRTSRRRYFRPGGNGEGRNPSAVCQPPAKAYHRGNGHNLRLPACSTFPNARFGT